MDINEQKKRMLKYTDFFGGNLLDYDLIKTAKSKQELKQIIDNHYDHLEMQVNDAQRSLDRFKKEIKLTDLDI